MNIFITGGSGFIGKVLVQKLYTAGHNLILLVRPSSDLRDLPASGIEFVQESLFNIEGLRQAMSSCDCLVHLANVYSFWEKDPAIYRQVNIEGTRCIYQAAMQARIKKVLHISTAVVWGDAQESPYTETSLPGENIFSVYAQSKREADELAWQFHSAGLPIVGIYPASVIGPGDKKSSGQMAREIAQGKLPATGLHHSRITFVDVQDVAEVLFRLIEQNDVIGEKFIVGKESITLGEYMAIVSRESGKGLPLIALPVWGVWAVSGLVSGLSKITRKPPLWGMSLDQTRTFVHGFQCDGSKAERLLGRPYRPVSESLRDTVQWILSSTKEMD
jgi:dihydroflavonol-4-reductase